MRYKDFRIDYKEEGGSFGGFVGYAATFDREPDSYGDVIAPGAFSDTLKAWADSGRPVPLLYGHNMDDPDYNIGVAELSEDETGLLAHAAFDESPKAQRVRELVREGRLAKMSFAYDVLEEAPVELDGGAKANELRRLDLYEVSVVLVPANHHAEILEAKARAKSERAKDEGEARAAIERAREALDEALSLLSPDEPSDDADEAEGEEPDAANPDGKSGEEIARKLKSLIAQ